MRIDNKGVGIEYTDEGRGRPVLLLHGWPDSGRLWRQQVPALIGAGFRTLVPEH
jgi:non-heme chloroperoxidase